METLTKARLVGLAKEGKKELKAQTCEAPDEVQMFITLLEDCAAGKGSAKVCGAKELCPSVGRSWSCSLLLSLALSCLLYMIFFSINRPKNPTPSPLPR